MPLSLSIACNINEDNSRLILTWQELELPLKLPIKWLSPQSINDKVFSEMSDVISEVAARNLKD